MRSSSFIFKIFCIFILAAVMTGCASPTPTPTAVPTIDVAPTLDAVRTQAVDAAMADLTKNAPTATFTPTATLTSTPSPTPTVTNTLLPLWTLTPTLTSAGCSIIEFGPDLNSTFEPNASFDGRWLIKNISGNAWKQDEVKIRYVSGARFQVDDEDEDKDVDLTGDVGVRGSTEVIVDMQAPAQPGYYVTNWAVFKDGTVQCGLTLSIRVP